MKAEQPIKSSAADWLKWFGVWILIAALVGANYYFADQSTPVKIIWSLGGFLAALTLVSFTTQGRKAWNFVREARIELRKVLWPTRQEAIYWTVMVIIVVVIMALFLWGVDSILLWGVKFFTK